MKKVTVIAPANIAFIKFWGRLDDELFLPLNSSISMSMSNCLTTTTAMLDPDLKEDMVEIKSNNEKEYQQIQKNGEIKDKNIFEQIARIRNLSDIKTKVRIRTFNSFPANSGIASSASGFSALTAALLLIYGLRDKFADKQELSRQVRLCGSASAARSVYEGVVELLAGKTHEQSYAVKLYDKNYWDLIDLVCIIDPGKKKVSSSQGHLKSSSSHFMTARQAELPQRIKDCKLALKNKDLKLLGEVIEADALSMHAVMLTQEPALIYWEPGTISVMKQLISMREDKGLFAYFTMDAGANVHVITTAKYQTQVLKELKTNPFIKDIIVNSAGEGIKISDEHLIN